ncbi:carbohydrate ABC transporter permease [Paenibacillus macerans]|uniref:carbohydrate ABC transporter permease n=1 Tax=Paenibacillus macerans TaxID=44252 RepID=UPI003D31C123
MQKLLGDKKAIFLFVFPTFVVFTVIIILPIFFSGYYSLLNWDGFTVSKFIGLQNYVDLFSNNSDGFTKGIKNSIILAVVSVGIQLPVSLLLALILARGVKLEKLYRTVYFIPVIISTVVIGQLWMKIYHPSYGMLNILLNNLGLGALATEWLGNTHTALGAVFVSLLWQYVGYHMLLMYASAKSISTDIYEAAKIDGANEATMATRITIPLMKPILRVCVVFSVIGSFKTFDLIYVLTNGGPLHATDVPTTIMYTSIFAKYQYGYGSAMAIFIIVECLVATVLIQRAFGKDAVY